MTIRVLTNYVREANRLLKDKNLLKRYKCELSDAREKFCSACDLAELPDPSRKAHWKSIRKDRQIELVSVIHQCEESLG